MGILIPPKKITRWEKFATFIQLGILVFAIVAVILSYDASNRAIETANRANDLTEQSLDIIIRQSNYSIQVIPYPIFAWIEGSYINGSTRPVIANGFLNSTLIVISPHVVRITIENMSIQTIDKLVTDYKILENDTIVNDPTILPEFDKTKFDAWLFAFDPNSELRSLPYAIAENNYTYYTSREGINTINISLHISASFYLNPQHNFVSNYQNFTIVDLGIVTVNARIFDMQTQEPPTSTSFQTNLLVYVKIQD